LNIDANTGLGTPYSAPLTEYSTGEGLNTLDAENGILYFLGTQYNSSSRLIETYVVGLDVTQKGKVTYTVPLTGLAEVAYPGLGQTIDFCDYQQVLYVTGHLEADGDDYTKHGLYVVNPVTGDVKVVGSFSMEGLTDVVGGMSSISPFSLAFIGLYYVNNVPTIIEVDSRNAQIINTFADTPIMQTMTFDENTGNFIGMGLSDDSTSRSVVQFASDDGSFTMDGIVNDVHEGEVYLNSNVQALNSTTRLLYLYMTDNLYSTSGFDFLAIDCDNAKVKHTASNISATTLPFGLYAYISSPTGGQL
jgi:hypothetical protein